MSIIVACLVIIFLIFAFVVFTGAPYVPSQRRYVDEAFQQLYPLSKKDVLLDLGSGDGLVLRAAARKGARAIGYELNPFLVFISRMLSLSQHLVSVRLADMWRTPFPIDVTVLYIFAVSRDGKRLVKKLQIETDRLHRPLAVMTFGADLPGQTAKKAHKAYTLYEFVPRQPESASGTL